MRCDVSLVLGISPPQDGEPAFSSFECPTFVGTVRRRRVASCRWSAKMGGLVLCLRGSGPHFNGLFWPRGVAQSSRVLEGSLVWLCDWPPPQHPSPTRRLAPCRSPSPTAVLSSPCTAVFPPAFWLRLVSWNAQQHPGHQTQSQERSAGATLPGDQGWHENRWSQEIPGPFHHLGTHLTWEARGRGIGFPSCQEELKFLSRTGLAGRRPGALLSGQSLNGSVWPFLITRLELSAPRRLFASLSRSRVTVNLVIPDKTEACIWCAYQFVCNWSWTPEYWGGFTVRGSVQPSSCVFLLLGSCDGLQINCASGVWWWWGSCHGTQWPACADSFGIFTGCLSYGDPFMHTCPSLPRRASWPCPLPIALL